MSVQSTGLSDDEVALVVSPKRACIMLNMSPPTLYELINSGKLESYKDGASRKITVASIKRHIAGQLAVARSTVRAA
jgi:excisionase family DNA binding protein